MLLLHLIKLSSAVKSDKKQIITKQTSVIHHLYTFQSNNQAVSDTYRKVLTCKSVKFAEWLLKQLCVSVCVSPAAQLSSLWGDYYYESHGEGLQKLFPQLGALQALYLLSHWTHTHAHRLHSVFWIKREALYVSGSQRSIILCLGCWLNHLKMFRGEMSQLVWGRRLLWGWHPMPGIGWSTYVSSNVHCQGAANQNKVGMKAGGTCFTQRMIWEEATYHPVWDK